MIILIHGKKRSGKDTLAGILKELESGCVIRPFAGPLKEITAKAFEMTLETVDYLKNDEEIKIGFRSPYEKLCTGNSMRNFLQNLGTEAMKPIFGDYVWAELFWKDYLRSPAGTIMIASDFRVPEEFNFLVNEAQNKEQVFSTKDIITVEIKRDEAEDSGDPHVTESGLMNFSFDYTIDNNGTLDDLRVEAVELLDFIQAKIKG